MQQENLTSERVELGTTVEAIEYFFDQGWTDGLPIIPATEERVQQFLAQVGKAPSDVIGVVSTRGRVITAEKIAINAIMAGCRPEYMPVLVAIVEAMCEPEFNYHGSLASTGSSAQLIVVNGPIASELGINSNVNVFGPGFRPNATIGRAVRLIIINVTGGVPGVLDKSTLGQGGKYSMCIAENEEISPWEPLHVQRGFSLEDSAVTVFAVFSPMQFSDHFSNTPESYLDDVADRMTAFGHNMDEFVIVLSQEHARIFRNARWSKQQAMDYLHQHAVISTERLKRQASIRGPAGDGDASEMHPIVKTPNGIVFLVAGGEAGGFSSLISRWGSGGPNSRSVTKLIQT
jgi:hypothetical protein